MAYLLSEHHRPSYNHWSLIVSQLKLKNIWTSLPCFTSHKNITFTKPARSCMTYCISHTPVQEIQPFPYHWLQITKLNVEQSQGHKVRSIFTKIGQEKEKLREEKYWHVAIGFVDFLPWKQKRVMVMMMMMMMMMMMIELKLLKLISRDH